METGYIKYDLRESLESLLKRIIMQEPLIDRKSTLHSIEGIPDNIDNFNIFFGTGISNPNGLSIGVPFDFLLYPLLAAKLQKKLTNCEIHHLIADNHALINNANKKDIRKLAASFRKSVEDIVNNLGIENYHIYLASEIATDTTYKKLFESLNVVNNENEYFRFEATDIEYFHRTRNVQLKLGWKFKGNGNRDENIFDKTYTKNFGHGVFSVYTSSGKRFDDKKPNAVPYTLYQSEINNRIIIDKNEDVLQKVKSQNCSDQTINMLKKHYSAIVRLFCEVCRRVPDSFGTIWDKLQYINQFITL